MSRTASLILITCGIALAGLSTPVSADSIETAMGNLPTPLGKSAVATDGNNIFIFGGTSCCSGPGATDAIYRYDPRADNVSLMFGRLPTPRYGAQAVWTGTAFLIAGGFSGVGGSAPLDEIIRYDPQTDTAQTMPTRLLAGEYDAAAAWDGHAMFIFSGRNSALQFGRTENTMKYDPAAGTVVNLSQSPIGEGGSAVFDGTNIWLTQYNVLVRYNPVTDTAYRVTEKFTVGANGCGYASLAWDGRDLYTIGGAPNGDCDGTRILRYNLATNQSSPMAAKLPRTLAAAGAAWNGSKIFIIGGGQNYDIVGASSAIYRYNETPGIPGNPAAKTGPQVGGITVQWNAPDPTTYAELLGFRLYRSPPNASSPLTFVTELAPSANSFNDQGLQAATAYTYHIRAHNSRGEGDAATARGRTFSPPDAPALFAASPGAERGTIELVWQRPASDGGKPITGYTLRILNGSVLLRETSLDASNTSWTERGLAMGEERAFDLAALNAVGASAQSTARARAPSPPGPPDSIQVQPSARGTLVVSWPATAGAQSYKVYRSQEGTSELLVGESTVARFMDENLEDSKTFSYRVTALNIVGEGQKSTRAAGNTPSPARAAFTFEPTAPGVGERIQFEDTSESDGTIVSWSWDFGDGSRSTQRNPASSFSSKGQHPVSLTIRDSFGFTDTVNQQLPIGVSSGSTSRGNEAPLGVALPLVALALLALFTRRK